MSVLKVLVFGLFVTTLSSCWTDTPNEEIEEIEEIDVSSPEEFSPDSNDPAQLPRETTRPKRIENVQDRRIGSSAELQSKRNSAGQNHSLTKELIKKINGPDYDTAQSALAELSCDPDQFREDQGLINQLIIPALLRIMADQEKGLMRKMAAEKLMSLKEFGKPAVPKLIASLDDQTLRPHIARGLGNMGPVANRGVHKLRQLLMNSDKETRIDGALGIEQFGPRASSAVPELVEVMDVQDGELQESACRALAAIGKSSSMAIPLLKQISKSGNGAAKQAAIAALQEITNAKQ